MAGATSHQQQEIVRKTLALLQQMPEGVTPPEIGTKVHKMVREMTGAHDPYQQVKQVATEQALAMLPELRTLLDASEHPLETALRLSIAGNIIDFGPNSDYELGEVVERILAADLAVDDTQRLRDKLSEVNKILYLSDNAGETVFDRLLIETLPKPVTYVVRSGPVINDATMADALAAGIDQVAEVISNGTQDPGTILSNCSPSFQTAFRSAELILAKGMGNYETLSGVPGPIFFLLQVKCPVISQDIGAPVGSPIVLQGSA